MDSNATQDNDLQMVEETTRTDEVIEEVIEEVIDEVIDEVSEKETYGQYTGNTKWFNDKLGYGFITICDGEEKGKDIFVHHSGVKPLNSNYKTLRKGEYIQFNITNGMNGLQAVDVTGIKGGPLMCDYVTSKRLLPPPYQPRHQTVNDNSGWQTIATRRPGFQRTLPPQTQHLQLSQQLQPPPPPRGRGVGATSRPAKNIAKYNKSTRH